MNISNAIAAIANFIWGWPLLGLLLGTHIFLTIRLKFIQRYIGKAIKLSFKKDIDSEGHISQFSALATSLAATIGTGNIVGVATAVSMGGPGAVFWTWITGVLGISTKYAEGLLAVKYRVRTKSGGYAGGPMYALEYGLNQKTLAILFAFFTMIAAIACGSSIQANSITDALNSSFGFNKAWVAAIVMVLAGSAMLGGIKSIARISNNLVPFMAVFYIISCLLILISGYENILSSIQLIITAAFTKQAALGGFAGSTIMLAARFGVARGLLSNESGLGSAPIIAAAAKTKNPVRQALVSSSGTFWDTVVICAITGLVLVNTGVWNSGLKGIKLTQEAFNTIPFGSGMLSISLIAFTFSTIIGWSYYGEKCCEYLWGKKTIIYFRIVYIVSIFFGGIFELDLVWNFGDISTGLMAFPNLIALILLSGVVVSETKKYLWDKKLDDVSKDELKQHRK